MAERRCENEGVLVADLDAVACRGVVARYTFQGRSLCRPCMGVALEADIAARKAARA